MTQGEFPFGSQCEMILRGLKRGERLTALSALQSFRCFRLAARIDDLKKRGHHIKKEMVSAVGKRFAVYSMEEK
jgi:hypothetical protein